MLMAAGDLIDEATLGPIRLRIHDSQFSPMLDGRDACREAAFDRAVVDAMRTRLTLPTRAGNVIEFRGHPPAYSAPLAFDPGWSSNSLSLMDLAGKAHAHKTYRRITPASREPGLLRLMEGSGQTQQLVGEYVLRQPDGSLVPLGVVYVYADGDGLDVPLRSSLRSVWPALAEGVPVENAVAAATADLVEPLTAAGNFLRSFHRVLADRLGQAPAFPVDDYLADTRDRIAQVAAMIRADGQHPAAAGEAVIDALHVTVSRGSAGPRRDWPSGASHGDLHLSHFLRTEDADGMWRMRLIDLSTPPLDPADPRHAAQSPWQDLVALLRGLACFTGDEFADRAAMDLGVESSDTCRTAYLMAAGLAPDTPGWTEHRLAQLFRLQHAASAWQNCISALLMRGYTRRTALGDHPAWRMFELRRLVHDLAYAYAHGRVYYAAITLRHALEKAAEGTGS